MKTETDELKLYDFSNQLKLLKEKIIEEEKEIVKSALKELNIKEGSYLCSKGHIGRFRFAEMHQNYYQDIELEDEEKNIKTSNYIVLRCTVINIKTFEPVQFNAITFELGEDFIISDEPVVV